MFKLKQNTIADIYQAFNNFISIKKLLYVTTELRPYKYSNEFEVFSLYHIKKIIISLLIKYIYISLILAFTRHFKPP